MQADNKRNLLLIAALLLLLGLTFVNFEKKNQPKNNYFPNPNAYPEYYQKDNPIHKAIVLHRTVKNCSDRAMIGEPQTIKLKNTDGTTRYSNYLCRDRYQEQCVSDGSFDTYYDEWCEDGNGNKIEVR